MIVLSGDCYIGGLIRVFRTETKRNTIEKRSTKMPYTILNKTPDGQIKRYGEFATEIEAVNTMKSDARQSVDIILAVAPELNLKVSETPDTCSVILTSEGNSHVTSELSVAYVDDESSDLD